MNQEMVNYEIELTKQTDKFVTNKLLKVILPVVLIVVLAVIFGIITGPERVELKKYLNTSPGITGLSGHAAIDISELFDISTFSGDLTEGLVEADLDELENMSNDELELIFKKQAEVYTECETAVNDIELTIWKNGKETESLNELSNGDIIKVEISSKTPNNEFFNKKFKTGSIQFTVDGLTEGKRVDAFDNADFEIKYVGVDGSGTVIVNWDAAAMPDLNVEFKVKDNTYSYSNGDKVEVILIYDKLSWEDKGYFPKEESRIYTVEGLSSYVKSVDEIPAEQLNLMKASVEDALNEDAETEWIGGISIERISYLGNYFLNRKESSNSYGAPNILYFVYKVDVVEDFTVDGGECNHISYYYYGAYEGVVINDKGIVDIDTLPLTTCRDSFSREVQTNSSEWFGLSNIYYYGYEKLNDLFVACVENYADQYSYVSTVQELDK